MKTNNMPIGYAIVLKDTNELATFEKFVELKIKGYYPIKGNRLYTKLGFAKTGLQQLPSDFAALCEIRPIFLGDRRLE